MKIESRVGEAESGLAAESWVEQTAAEVWGALSLSSGQVKAMKGSVGGPFYAESGSEIIADHDKVFAESGSAVTAGEGSRVYAQKGTEVNALKDSIVVADPGSKIFANEGSKIIAAPGASVVGESGSRIYAMKGANIDAKPGCTVIPLKQKYLGPDRDRDLYLDEWEEEGKEYVDLVYWSNGLTTVESDSYVRARNTSIVAESGSEVLADSHCEVVAKSGSSVSAYSCTHVKAEKGSVVYAGKGAFVIAEPGSEVHAEDGSYVRAKAGAKVIADEGSHVSEVWGAKVEYKGNPIFRFMGDSWDVFINAQHWGFYDEWKKRW